MTRIVAGSARGRQLSVPPGRVTRPTADRAREALFSTVDALRGPLVGSRFLDLYAGSGAVGLEALSRGAAHALLVEADARAGRVLRDNVGALGLSGAEVVVDKVERLATRERQARPPYDVVFADPPYTVTDAAVRRVLDDLHRAGWLTAGALVVVERSTRGGALTWPPGFEAERSRSYGEGTLWYGRAAGPDPV